MYRGMRRAIQPVASGAFAGAMDVAGFTTPYACWSLRAGSAAIAAAATQNLIDIVDQNNANPLTVKVLSTGELDVASISAWVAANSVTTITVVKVYDQSGNGNHMVGTGVLTGNAGPAVVLNALGTKAAMQFVFSGGTSSVLIAAANSPTTAQPITLAVIAKPIFNAQGARLFSDGTSGFQMMAGDTAGNANMFQGSGIADVGIFADSTWGSLAFVANGAASSINGSNAGFNTSATPTTVSPGTTGWVNTNKLTLGSRAQTGNDLPYNGYLFEALVTTTAVSPTNQASLIANQRAYGAY